MMNIAKQLIRKLVPNSEEQGLNRPSTEEGQLVAELCNSAPQIVHIAREAERLIRSEDKAASLKPSRSVQK